MQRRTPDPSGTWQDAEENSRSFKDLARCRGELQILQGLGKMQRRTPDPSRTWQDAEENSRSFSNLARCRGELQILQGLGKMPRRTPDPSGTWQEWHRCHSTPCLLSSLHTHTQCCIVACLNNIIINKSTDAQFRSSCTAWHSRSHGEGDHSSDPAAQHSTAGVMGRAITVQIQLHSIAQPESWGG